MRRLDKAGFKVFALDPVILSGQGGPADPATVEAGVEAVFANPRNVALEHGGGCMLFLWICGNFYDMHFLFPETVRGKEALISAREMLQAMFTGKAAAAIYGTITRSNRAARVFIRHLGFEQTSADAERVHYSMDRTQWLGSKQSQR